MSLTVGAGREEAPRENEQHDHHTRVDDEAPLLSILDEQGQCRRERDRQYRPSGGTDPLHRADRTG